MASRRSRVRRAQELYELLMTLTSDQVQVLGWLARGVSKKQAADEAKVKLDEVYRWGAGFSSIVERVRADPEAAADALMRLATFKAALVKLSQLETGTEEDRQRAASELIKVAEVRARREEAEAGMLANEADEEADRKERLASLLAKLNTPTPWEEEDR